jgi:ribosome recycling factor
MSLLCRKISRTVILPVTKQILITDALNTTVIFRDAIQHQNISTTCQSTNYSSVSTKSYDPFRHMSVGENNYAVINSRNRRQQIRCKHGARIGLHLQNLDAMAHRSEQELAEERRQKKKEKTAARKGGKKVAGLPQEGVNEFDSFDLDKKKLLKDSGDDDDWEEPEEEDDEHDENILPDLNAVKGKMMKHVDTFKGYLKTIRGGQQSAEMFDDTMVRDAYGHGSGDVSLKAVAQIVMTSPTLAIATCFDPATAKAVSKAIRDTLELNPQIEEGTGAIKIPIPRISMEVRQQSVVNIQKRAENFRVRIRNNRRAALDIVKKGVAGKLDGVSKDDAFRVQQEIESMTDVVIKELNKVLEKKENDIMSV